MSFLTGILLLLCTTAASAQAPAVVVGAVVSQSGSLAPLADTYRKGLLLWRDEVNSSGGLLGRPVDLRLRDDGSDAVRTGELYGELIRNDTADLLLGPFGSAAALMAGAEAERARRVLVNGGGPSQAVQRRGTRYMFQAAIPNAAYGEGIVQLVRAAGVRNVLIAARDDLTSLEMAEAARQSAGAGGLQAGELAVYSNSTDSFAPLIEKAKGAQAQAWIAFGGVRDAAQMVRDMKASGYAPQVFFARAAADHRLIELVGQDAEFTLGAQAYDPSYATSGNERFVRAYRAKWSSPPDAAAAHAYAAGTVLAEAVRRADTLDQEKLRAALAALEMETVLGGYRADPETGGQLAAKPAVVQILFGRPQVVWPEWLQTATRETYPAWDERRLIER